MIKHYYLAVFSSKIPESGIWNLKLRKMEYVSCSFCGCSFGEFSESGMFGCAHCYEVFEDFLSLMAGDIKSFEWIKKKLEKEETLNIDSDISELKRKLSEAVVFEEYEKAAKIRDKLMTLEAQDSNK